jgi:hypothetical protein
LNANLGEATTEDEQLMLELFQKNLADTDIPETFAKVTDLSL